MGDRVVSKIRSKLCWACLFLLGLHNHALPADSTRDAPLYQRHHIGFPHEGYRILSQADIAPEKDLYPYSYSLSPDRTLILTRRLGENEALWGLGGAGEPFNLRGQNVYVRSGRAAPLLLSSDGHGLFINYAGLLHVDIGASDPGILRIIIPDNGVELFTFSGPLPKLMDTYYRLVGHPRAIPDWVYRPWLGRSVFFGHHETTEALRRFDEFGITLAAVILEDWQDLGDDWNMDRSRYPMPLTWIHELSLRNVNVLLQIPGDDLTMSRIHQLSEKGIRGLFLEADSGGRIDDQPSDLDESLLDLVLVGSQHNANLPLSHLIRSETPRAIWDRLAQRVRAGLASGLSGAPFWSEAIGGYFGVPEKELYIRWLQWATFAPALRFHALSHLHAPWTYDAETESIALFYARVRERLQDTLQSLGEEAHQSGAPLLRPLVWHFPDDTETHSIGSQFMLGPDLLVAPIVTPNPTRIIYLPEGYWIDAWTHQVHEGPAHVTQRYELHQIPLFVREEQWPQYSDLFDGHPEVVEQPILVERIDDPNKRGVIPLFRHWKNTDLTETFRYRITNTTDESIHFTARSTPQLLVIVHPLEMVRFTLPPGEDIELIFEARPDGRLFPGTYPIPVEIRHGTDLLNTPPAMLVVHPLWQHAPAQVGGLAYPGDWDGHDIDIDALNETDWNWIEVPLSALRDDGFWDLGTLQDSAPHQTRFLRARILSERTRRADFLIGSGDAITVWFNGQMIHETAYVRNPTTAEARVETVLLEGENEVIVRLRRDLAPDWFYFRVE